MPDFVLVEEATKRWILVVEIKRTVEDVRSERTQIQSKGYVEANTSLFKTDRPRYFAITNLEVLQLFALRGASPPRDCAVEGQTFEAGRFSDGDPKTHRARLIESIVDVVRYALEEQHPAFSVVWPTIVARMFQHARQIPFRAGMDLSGTHLPVQGYFGGDRRDEARDELLLRCLITEYARGVLQRYKHPRAARLRPIGGTLASVANAFVKLRSIDFAGVLEDAAGSTYVALEKDAEVREGVQAYLKTLYDDQVSTLAFSRADAPVITDLIIRGSRPSAGRDMRGKAGTDPELAGLLAALCIRESDQHVLDPGWGEGNLLSAAYDRMQMFKTAGTPKAVHRDILHHLSGIEADSIAARIAGLRLALKEPHALGADDPIVAEVGDMFNAADRIAASDVILMNPPFKRYEKQDDAPIPDSLRAYMIAEMQKVGGEPVTATGQWNTLALYSEYVVKAAGAGATIGLVLDNKWFHNDASKTLRQLFAGQCRILAIVTYPHGRFFKGVMIATSMIVMEKSAAALDHVTLFLRVDDPGACPADVAHAAIRGGRLPIGWAANRVSQSELGAESWKGFLSVPLKHEYRKSPLRPLAELFSTSRRGSLAKEAGPVALLEFPVNRSRYGPSVSACPSGKRFKTTRGAPLSVKQNAELKNAASAIPEDCLGFALNKADRVTGYYLRKRDLMVDPTIELPLQRTPSYFSKYRSGTKAPWDLDAERIVNDIPNHPALDGYVKLISSEVGLDTSILPEDQLWNVLREPYAGSLIIPRKLRNKHHVHINPYAFAAERQVRLSSNFISYGDCVAVDEATGLDERTATILIAAWLVSSFGHLQFEMESNNREGMRTIEKKQTDKIVTIDPRSISVSSRQNIVKAFDDLPDSIRAGLHPCYQSELSVLDALFADELQKILDGFDAKAGLAEVQEVLNDAHEARL